MKSFFDFEWKSAKRQGEYDRPIPVNAKLVAAYRKRAEAGEELTKGERSYLEAAEASERATGERKQELRAQWDLFNPGHPYPDDIK